MEPLHPLALTRKIVWLSHWQPFSDCHGSFGAIRGVFRQLPDSTRQRWVSHSAQFERSEAQSRNVLLLI